MYNGLNYAHGIILGIRGWIAEYLRRFCAHCRLWSCAPSPFECQACGSVFRLGKERVGKDLQALNTEQRVLRALSCLLPSFTSARRHGSGRSTQGVESHNMPILHGASKTVLSPLEPASPRPRTVICG